jgi:hypothetical protein
VLQLLSDARRPGDIAGYSTNRYQPGSICINIVQALIACFQHCSGDFMNKSSLLVVATGLVFCLNAHALELQEDLSKVNVEEIDAIDWDRAFKRMKMLSPMGFHPFLMPLIMKNRDFIELTPEQLRVFKRWRDKNRVPMLHTMDKIIYERNLFNKLALQPDTSNEVLMTKQREIFKLHEKVLEYQLSCRRNILDTFSAEQWDNFRFVLGENGYEI